MVMKWEDRSIYMDREDWTYVLEEEHAAKIKKLEMRSQQRLEEEQDKMKLEMKACVLNMIAMGTSEEIILKGFSLSPAQLAEIKRAFKNKES